MIIEHLLSEVSWETRNLGLTSFELSEDGLLGIRDPTPTILSDAGVRLGHDFFVQLRVDARNFASVRMAEDLGFRLVETSIQTELLFSRASVVNQYCADPNRFYPSDISRVDLEARSQVAVDLQEDQKRQIIGVATRIFRTGRFHADPGCSNMLADQRMAIWITADLFPRPEVMCDTLYCRGEVVGFILRKGDRFILGGLAPQFIGRGLSKFLYLESMKNVSDAGAESISAKISAANIEVLNLYSRLGFSFLDPYYVYHFWYRYSKI